MDLTQDAAGLDATAAIGPLGTLRDAADEAAFRASELARHAHTARILIATLLLSNVLLVNDYRLFGGTRAFWELLAARVAFAVLSGVAYLLLRRPATARAFDATVLSWSAGLIALMTYVSTTRPAGSFAYVVVTVGVVLLTYVAVPLPLTALVVLALSSSAATLFTFLHGGRGPDPLIPLTLVVTLLLGNLVGAMAARRLNTWNRLQFVALRAETRLRQRLEQALAEIKTLEGMLPICSYCRRLRTETGEWEQMEVYLGHRTDARFTHGICPDCTHEHFPEQV